MNFQTWFSDITGQPPYPYQVALASAHVLPDLLSVPTGTGKTAAAVLGWLWRRRFGPPELRVATPRRLVFCLPMRTLVEQTVGVAKRWLAAAGLDPEAHVHQLMGGAVAQDWDLAPDVDAILVGTQDQLLSRALNRGYAMSRFRWPWHFGMLHSDCLWVMDEVQLMGVGLTTSAQLQGLREQLGTAMPSRTLWMSATLAAGRLATVDLRGRPLTNLGLEAADREHPSLSRRLLARKRLLAAKQTITKKDARADALASEILAAHRPGDLTLVVVNRVRRAQELYQALRRRAADTPLGLLHSRFRPSERRPLQAALLPPPPAAPWKGILVATQAIEAGVDISARTLFTEVASWPSMIQRFGRCNRAGEYADAEIRWIDVIEDPAPYTEEDLTLARAHLHGLDDVGPAALARLPQEPGVPEPPVLRRRDLLDLFDTDPDLAGHDIDIARFIRAGDDADVQVAWRTWPGPADQAPPADSAALQAGELCRVPVHALRDFLKKQRGAAYRWSSLDGAWERVGWERLFPGMTLLLPVGLGGYDPAIGWTGDPAHRPASVLEESEAEREDADAADPVSNACADYVTLVTHAQDVVEELRAMAATLGGGDRIPWNVLERAARWHDLGKVHPAFQAMLTHRLPPDDPHRGGGPWAKSDGLHGAARCLQRPGFRHELASALAFLAQGGDDLGAYLVAAHHGKVRLAIRAAANESAPPEAERRFARGVWHGEVLPGADLGEGVTAAPVPLSLELMELGEHDGRPSWMARMLRLRDELGVFRLAYFEALIRIADVRGTRRHIAGPARKEPRA
jgi:CRISPR-associated endonuclease/helicase Cas3